MSQKRDVTKLNNENPVNRRIAGGIGLGGVLDAVLTWRTNGLESAPGLAIGSSDKHKIKVVNDTYYRLGGSLKLLAAATEVVFTATTDDITNSASLIKEAIYDVSVNSTGAVIITKGETATAPLAVAPPTPAGNVKIGEVRLAVAAGATPFDATTDELDEAHITDTYTDATPGPGVALA
jgi:hypothetical protein